MHVKVKKSLFRVAIRKATLKTIMPYETLDLTYNNNFLIILDIKKKTNLLLSNSCYQSVY